jgi:hypothetical protein
MSSELVVALVAVITTGVIGIAGLVFNFWNSSSERRQRLAEREQDYREWYRRTVFEKRLAAVQEAYQWIMRFNVAITEADASQPDSPKNEELRMLCKDAREWYDRNTVFLHGGLPHASEFIGLINTALAHANGQQFNVWKSFIAAEKDIKARVDELLSVEHIGKDGVPQ